jgi:hypothetical protein
MSRRSVWPRLRSVVATSRDSSPNNSLRMDRPAAMSQSAGGRRLTNAELFLGLDQFTIQAIEQAEVVVAVGRGKVHEANGGDTVDESSPGVL